MFLFYFYSSIHFKSNIVVGMSDKEGVYFQLFGIGNILYLVVHCRKLLIIPVHYYRGMENKLFVVGVLFYGVAYRDFVKLLMKRGELFVLFNPYP